MWWPEGGKYSLFLFNLKRQFSRFCPLSRRPTEYTSACIHLHLLITYRHRERQRETVWDTQGLYSMPVHSHRLPSCRDSKWPNSKQTGFWLPYDTHTHTRFSNWFLMEVDISKKSLNFWKHSLKRLPPSYIIYIRLWTRKIAASLCLEPCRMES